MNNMLAFDISDYPVKKPILDRYTLSYPKFREFLDLSLRAFIKFDDPENRIQERFELLAHRLDNYLAALDSAPHDNSIFDPAKSCNGPMLKEIRPIFIAQMNPGVLRLPQVITKSQAVILGTWMFNIGFESLTAYVLAACDREIDPVQTRDIISSMSRWIRLYGRRFPPEVIERWIRVESDKAPSVENLQTEVVGKKLWIKSRVWMGKAYPLDRNGHQTELVLDVGIAEDNMLDDNEMAKVKGASDE